MKLLRASGHGSSGKESSGTLTTRWTSSKTRKAFSADQQRLISQASIPRMTRTLSEPQRSERADGNNVQNERKEALRDLRIRTLGSDSTRAVHGSRHHAQHVAGTSFSARGDDDAFVPVPKQHVAREAVGSPGRRCATTETASAETAKAWRTTLWLHRSRRLVAQSDA